MSDSSHAPIDYATPMPRPRRRVGLLMVLFVLVFLLGVAVPVMLFLVTRAPEYTAVGTVVVGQPVAPTGLIAPATPSRLTIVQRTAQPLPGTGGTITARIGDITGGQVLVTIEETARQPLLHTVSMKQGDIGSFVIDGNPFDIELIELKNFLTGDDFAVFEVRQAGAGMSEAEKIDRLISAVAGAEGVIFIRNGAEHSPADAAEHLKRKFNSAGEPGMTARQFIEEVANRSSISDQPYRVRLPDGRELTSEQWLRSKLTDIESMRASAPLGR